MFQIKDFASISASLINWMRSNTSRVTDFNQGSVARTMLEATAVEIEELYIQVFVGLKEAIPVSVYNTFGFPPLDAKNASGIVRFTAPAPAAAAITIPAATQVKSASNGQIYATQATAYIMTGQTYVDVLVAAAAAGTVGNADAATITEVVGSLPGVSSATNPARIFNGRDAESPAERRSRFQGYISTLARGTKPAVEYGAKTARLVSSEGAVTESVAFAGVVEPYIADNTQPISKVFCYVHNGIGATSVGLVAEAQRIIDGYLLDDGSPAAGSSWKAAGVVCVVAAASDTSVAVTGTVSVDPGYSSAPVLIDCQSAIQGYIQSLSVGAKVQFAEIVAILKRDVAGVLNVVISAPSADVTIAANAKAVPGTITLTAV